MAKKGNEAALAFLRSKGVRLGPGPSTTTPSVQAPNPMKKEEPIVESLKKEPASVEKSEAPSSQLEKKSKTSKLKKTFILSSVALGIGALGYGAYEGINWHLRGKRVESKAADIKRCAIKAPENCMTRADENILVGVKVRATTGQSINKEYKKICIGGKIASPEPCRNLKESIVVLDNIEREVSQVLASDYKRCSGKADLPSGCMGPQEKERLRNAAETAKDAGQYAKAGLRYAELGMVREAKGMADKCKTGDSVQGKVINQDVSGAKDIEQALDEYSDALEKSAR